MKKIELHQHLDCSVSYDFAKLFEPNDTDGRTISDVTLTGEYRDIAATFGWTDEHFAACNRAAIDAAFASDAVKEKLRYRNSVPGS